MNRALAKIDKFILTEMAEHTIPGVSLGIFNNGIPLYLRCYGTSDIERNIKVQPDTLFHVASIGKMFTAAAVMLLVDEGKLSLDSTIKKYLPDAPQTWEEITLRHLLTHTSGLGEAEYELSQELSDDEYLQKYYTVPFIFTPGDCWEYSNLGYSTLGFVVNKVAEISYSELLTQRIFKPAGMATAGLPGRCNAITSCATGYDKVQGLLNKEQMVSESANRLAEGSLCLSLLDFSQWDAVVARRSLLNPLSWQHVLQPVLLNNGSFYPYGFGWDVNKTLSGKKLIGHDGSWNGFRSSLRRFDDEGLTFAVLTNAGHTDISHMMYEIINIFDIDLNLQNFDLRKAL